MRARQQARGGIPVVSRGNAPARGAGGRRPRAQHARHTSAQGAGRAAPAQRTPLISGVKTWYAADALGSVRRTVTNAGTPLGVVNYDPWGMPESGTVPTFGFTGEVQDATTGLVNLRAR